ncbi:MAG: hypothetical protein AB4352_11665 [Hormoscilla sp.]
MGFLSNMFNLKTKYVDEPDDPADMAPKESTKAFYLDPDDAKTLKKNTQPVRDSSSGNKVLDTTSPAVKDTSQEEVAPAIESQATVDQQVAPDSETTSSETSESTSTDGGPADDSMDMFRNMARNIKKR